MAEKTCLVFGGSGALGGVVCRTLAEQGARVAFTYHRGERAAAELTEILPGSVALRADLGVNGGSAGAVRDAAAALGGLDAFVQCAGLALPVECAGTKSHHLMAQIDESGWDEILDLNAKSTFFAVRALASAMAEKGGNIVLTGSVDGVKPVPSPVHYAASKGALRAMAQAMAKELGPQGIRVNMVAPGLMEGGISRDLPDDLRAEYVKHCGMKRVGRLEEIASVIAYLALENTYVTGQTVLVDGGL